MVAEERPKPIPIPKTLAELEAEADAEAFYNSTKGFRQQLHVKEMIKERKQWHQQKKLGETEHDELYQCEQSVEYMKPVNVEKIMRIT